MRREAQVLPPAFLAAIIFFFNVLLAGLNERRTTYSMGELLISYWAISIIRIWLTTKMQNEAMLVWCGYAKGAVELDRYIEVSLHRDSRYNDIAVK